MSSTFLLLTVSASLAACGLVNPDEVTSERSASSSATVNEVESEDSETILVLPSSTLPKDIEDNQPPTTTNPVVIPPLPIISPDGKIKNPYYRTVAWKLWAEDPAPLQMKSGQLALSLAVADRLVPNLDAVVPSPGQFLPTKVGESTSAGFWDDVYKTEDSAHTNLPTSWALGQSKINLSGQFLRLGAVVAETMVDNKQIGVNFTSQSTTCMGHNLVNDSSTLTYVERNYHFADIVRGGPSYYSFRDHLIDRTIDSYKGLPMVGHHSFGRSGSEVYGLLKMLITGGFLPRATKNLLKHHGLYPTVLHSLFVASLPYANADGSAVDYLNEMRHRPGFLSKGDSKNSEFMPYNEWYHRYPDGEHLYQMTQKAAKMSYTPPITLIKLISETREANGVTTTSTTNFSASRTTVLTPLTAGEKVTLVVDFSDSFDLGTLPLTYRWQILYPEQKNVKVVQTSPHVFTITATHDPRQPKMRIPILFASSNGILESSPVQVSFYPARVDPGCRSYELGANSANEMNVNLRPLFSAAPAGRISVEKGKTAVFTLNCTDPEGFATRYYRWLGEPGKLVGNSFSLKTVESDAGKTIALHFICSDGTGAYNSIEQEVLVTP